MAKKNYEEMSKQILECVGGKENISFFTHCVTRLRFNVRDKSRIKEEELKKIAGVLGVQWSGEQLQVIVGQSVSDLYSIICKSTGIAEEAAIDENLDQEKEKFSLKNIGKKAMTYLSNTMAGIIPVLIASAMFKTIGSLVGPDMLNIVTAESDFYILCNFLFNACFYFLPIYLGYSAAKALNTNVLLGIFMGAMILVPDFVAMVGVRETFSVFGIQVPVANYGQTFLPVVLGVWVMSYVYKFFNRYIPAMLKTLLVPFLTVMVMTVVMFAVCAPLGSYVGNVISAFFMSMADANPIIRVIGSILLGMAYPFLTLFGMHSAAYVAAYVTYFELGYESFLMPMGYILAWTINGIALGAMFKMKQKENKGLAVGYFSSAFVGGVTEPTLYGICLKYKSALKVLVITCGIGGLISGIIQPRVYAAVMGNIFTVTLLWTGGSTTNIILGVVLELACFIISFVGTLLFIDFKED